MSGVRFKFDTDRDVLELDRTTVLTDTMKHLKDSVNKKRKGFYAMSLQMRRMWGDEDTLIKNNVVAPMSSFYYLYQLISEVDEVETPMEDYPYYNTSVAASDIKSFIDHVFSKTCVDGKPFKPYDTQVECATAFIQKMRGIGEIPTAGGKTLTAYITYLCILKFMPDCGNLSYVVPTKTLLEQVGTDWAGFNAMIMDAFDGKPDFRLPEIHMLAKDYTKDQPNWKHKNASNIAVIGTRKSWSAVDKTYASFFRSLIFDEVHMSNNNESDTILDLFISCPYRLGMTATVPDTKFSDGVKLRWKWGIPVYSTTVDDMIATGKCVDVDVLQVFVNTTTEKQMEVMAKACTMLKKARKYTDMLRIEQSYLQKSQERLDIIMDIVRSIQAGKTHVEDDNMLFVFEHIEMGRVFYNYLDARFPDYECFYIDGSTSKNDRENIRQYMESHPKCMLVGSQKCIGTGFSVKNLRYAVLIEGWSSSITTAQVIGRLMRKHESKEGRNAIVVDIVDYLYRDCYMIRQGRERMNAFSSEFENTKSAVFKFDNNTKKGAWTATYKSDTNYGYRYFV